MPERLRNLPVLFSWKRTEQVLEPTLDSDCSTAACVPSECLLTDQVSHQLGECMVD